MLAVSNEAVAGLTCRKVQIYLFERIGRVARLRHVELLLGYGLHGRLRNLLCFLVLSSLRHHEGRSSLCTLLLARLSLRDLDGRLQGRLAFFLFEAKHYVIVVCLTDKLLFVVV